jgi:hypothetical protein
MTATESRTLALCLPGAEQCAHMDHPDFRVGGKVFATLGYPDDALVAAHPKMFAPVKGAWGKQGCTNVRLETAAEKPVREALAAAWERAAGGSQGAQPVGYPGKVQLKRPVDAAVCPTPTGRAA